MNSEHATKLIERIVLGDMDAMADVLKALTESTSFTATPSLPNEIRSLAQCLRSHGHLSWNEETLVSSWLEELARLKDITLPANVEEIVKRHEGSSMRDDRMLFSPSFFDADTRRHEAAVLADEHREKLLDVVRVQTDQIKLYESIFDRLKSLK